MQSYWVVSKTKDLRRNDMNTYAMMMMIISIVLLWGGLILATVHLVKHPDEEDD